jgi:hypothetical protein
MKKALLASKWWFYIPIISLFFIPKMSKWVFSGKTSNDMGWRDIVVAFSMIFHAFFAVGIIMYFIK